MSDADTYNNVVLFSPDSSSDDGGDDGGDDSSPLALLLDGPWHVRAGVRPDVNTATCSHVEFLKLGGNIGCSGTVQFCYTDPSSPDVEIDNILLIDAMPIRYGTPQGQDSAIPVMYRLTFADCRYNFVRPRGGRLNLGLVNPSETIPADSSNSNKPAPVSMNDLIQACLTAMGSLVSGVSIPDVSGIQPPQDLKWLGTHAPSELEKLMAMANCTLCLQSDGTFTMHTLGDGDQPSIDSDVQLPTTTLKGVDARGKTVIFTSYPTQVAYTATQDQLSPETFRFAAQDSTGAWREIDSSNAYGSSAIAEMNKGFPSTPSVPLQWECYRHMQIVPDYFDPITSPLRPRTFADPSDSGNGDAGGGDANANATLGLPPTVEMQFKANFAQQNATSGLWTMPTDFVDVAIMDKNNSNVLTFASRLVKLKSGTNSTSNLEKDCVPIDLSSDIKFRFTCAGAVWDDDASVFRPNFWYCGFSGGGDAGDTSPLTGKDAEDAMSGDDTIVIPLAELQSVVFNTKDTDDGETGANDTQLQKYCQALSTRYLKDSSNPAQLQGGVGFIEYTIDGVVAEVELDQGAGGRGPTTRFHVMTWFRPTGSYLASEFRRLVEPAHEAHPHEAKTQGKRTSAAAAGSNLATESLKSFFPPISTVSLIPVGVQKDGGSWGSGADASGNGATTCNVTYTCTQIGGGDLKDGTNTTSKTKMPQWNVRFPSMPYSQGSGPGLGYYDTASPPNFTLLFAPETPATTSGCT